MSQLSRDEKLAAAKKKLKKFQENTSKRKVTEENALSYLKNKKVPQYVNYNLHISDSERKENDKKLDQYNSINLELLEEPTATTESLKQISRHLNGIISCSNSSVDRESQQEHLNTIRELEKRNVELASFNSQKAEQLEYLNVKIESLNENIERISKECSNEKKNLENLFKKQIESNKIQLQSQIHTISLLVAEKSELQSQVNHNQKISNQRFQEIEDLTNKLKISRQKVGDLEKVLSDIKHVNNTSEEAKHDMSRQLEQMRYEFKKLKSEKDDLLTENTQLRSKLTLKTQEVSNFELTLDDIKSELEMSRVQIQHLTNNKEGQYDNLCTQLKATDKKNVELINELDSLRLQLQQTELQNNRLKTQYRNYFDQMEEKLSKLQFENHELTEINRNLMFQVEQMKRSTNDKQNETIDIEKESNYKIIINEMENERSSLMNEVEVLEQSNVSLKVKNTSLMHDNENLLKLVEELEEKNLDLTEKVKQFELNQIDYAQLLIQIKSDKTASSRALSQNKQLKSQLVELQEAFVKLSSDNMDYSTRLQHEKHVSKELALRLGEQEDELNDTRQELIQKNKEISKLSHINQQITDELLPLNNTTENDSLRRSETHFNMTNKIVIESLQNDLVNSQERINQLITENNNLMYQFNQKSTISLTNKDSCLEIDNLILTLRQTEAERDELLNKYEARQYKEYKSIENLNIDNSTNDKSVAFAELECMKNLNSQITEKLEDSINRNVQLMRENERLEHLVEQLEGETDTIAEYINLYQHQRTLLKQKCNTRDQLMSKLIYQKQLMENKLLHLKQLFQTISQIDYNELVQSNGLDADQPKDQSVYDQIFRIINELQKPNDIISQSGNDSFRNNENQNCDSFFDNSLITDDLLHYHIIHCKCCVGKVIDL